MESTLATVVIGEADFVATATQKRGHVDFLGSWDGVKVSLKQHQNSCGMPDPFRSSRLGWEGKTALRKNMTLTSPRYRTTPPPMP